MPFPLHTWRAQLYGQLANNLDVWNMVWNLNPGTLNFDTYGQAVADIVRDAVQTHLFSGACAAGFYVGTTFNGVNLYNIPDTGHATGLVNSPSDPAVYHGTGDQALPTECAVCVSLNTGKPGRSYAGRSYLPGISASVLDVNGYVAHGAAVAFATAVADCFGDIDSSHPDPVLGDPTVCVLSTKLGVLTGISSVRVGNIMDVQRRRRNGQPEGYVIEAVPGF